MTTEIEQQTHPVHAGHTDDLERISENLYLYRDICNVYLIKSRGGEGVLVDFGDGGILKHLESLGVTRISDVLMTHHHRDQGQGLHRAIAQGARVWVPQAEQDLFQAVDEHWQARPLYNNYNMRLDRFSLLEPILVAGALHDYAALTFGDTRFTVVPTPGHTPGSISLAAEIDGSPVIFTGDLIAEGGKVWAISATQWSYNGQEGIAASIPSLVDLKKRSPRLLLPSHGNIITEPEKDIDLLVSRYARLLTLRQQNPRLFRWMEKPYEHVTEHLLRNVTSMANSYVLLSESRKALFIDFGYDFMTGLAAGNDRASRRPWLYTIPFLKRDFGVERIDVAIPTHYHDDHVAGMNLLKEVEGTQIWAPENFAKIMLLPNRYDLPCLWYDSILADRVIPMGKPVRWEEYEITAYELPGHTLFAAAIVFTVDGKRVMAIGDQYQDESGLKINYVYQGHFRIRDYKQSAELYRQVQPDLVISGHWLPMWVQPGYIDQIDARGEELEQLHKDLLLDELMGFGPEGFGVDIQPYQTTVNAGEEVTFDVEVRNPLPSQGSAQVRLVVPEGWQVEENEVTIHFNGKPAHVVQFHVQVPEGVHVRRSRVAADLTVGSQRFGQMAEAVVTVV